MYVCGGSRGYVHVSTVPMEARDGVRSPGTEVISCELTAEVLGMELRSSARALHPFC